MHSTLSNSDRLRVTGTWLLVKLDALPDRSGGGIVLPGAYQLPSCVGKVIGCGERVNTHPKNVNGVRGLGLDIWPGDRVAFNWIDATQVGKEIEWRGETLHFMRATDVKLVLESAETKVETAG